MITPVQFEGSNTIIAANQKPYIPLPAHLSSDVRGPTTICWKLGLRDRIVVALTGRLWHQVMQFGKHLQPQKLMVDKPELT